MPDSTFRTPDGHIVASVTADQMRDVDRVAVEDVGVALLQMMENAGRILAWHAREVRDTPEETVLVLAGSGGNGGGGMACARHLANRDVPVHVFLASESEEVDGQAGHQLEILQEMGVAVETSPDGLTCPQEPVVVVDALIGYGLRGDVRKTGRRYVEWMNNRNGTIISLDVPSGIDATSGETQGVSVSPNRTITLALPKTGLRYIPGSLYLADISIPATVYERLDIGYANPFDDRDWVKLESSPDRG